MLKGKKDREAKFCPQNMQALLDFFFPESAGELRIILIREEKEVQNGPRYKACNLLD
jgi:hypothetical protein